MLLCYLLERLTYKVSQKNLILTAFMGYIFALDLLIPDILYQIILIFVRIITKFVCGLFNNDDIQKLDKNNANTK